MKFIRKNFWYLLIGFVVFMAVVKQCEKEPKIKEVTKIEYVKVTDTITKTIISEPKTVYVNKYRDVKGKDSIVYVNKADSTTIKANQYNTKLESNNATASLKITTTGELLDVQGTIDYTQTNTTTTITKVKPESGLFLYGEVPINRNVSGIELGLIYQFKNAFLIKGGAEYNNITKSIDLKAGIGIKIF